MCIDGSWFVGNIHEEPYANCEPYTAKPLGIGLKWNVYKRFRRRPGRPRGKT